MTVPTEKTQYEMYEEPGCKITCTKSLVMKRRCPEKGSSEVHLSFLFDGHAVLFYRWDHLRDRLAAEPELSQHLQGTVLGAIEPFCCIHLYCPSSTLPMQKTITSSATGINVDLVTSQHRLTIFVTPKKVTNSP